MARTRVTKTVTVGELKFKPTTGRERSTPDGPERYWQARRYIGVVDGKPRREQVWRGWARADQLTAIAANLTGDEGSATQTAAGPGLATLDDLRSGTVELLVKAWRGERKGDKDYSEYTRRHDRTIQKRLVEVIGGLRLSDVDGARTGEYLRKELRKQYAVSTVRLTMTVFAGIWNRWAFHRGIVDRQIDFSASYRRLLKTEQAGLDTGAREKITPSDDEAWAIADELESCAPPWASLAYRLLLSTGGRIGEIAVLTWGDVEDSSVHLEGKTGPRDVEVDPRALQPIRASRPPGATDETRVLTVTDNTARKHFAMYLDRACEAAEAPRITPHAIRRLVVRRYIRAGVPPSIAAKQLGHTPEVMLREYEQVTMDDQRAAARLAEVGVRPAPPSSESKVVHLRT